MGAKRIFKIRRFLLRNLKTNLINIFIVSIFVIILLWIFRLIRPIGWHQGPEIETKQKMNVLALNIYSFSRKNKRVPSSEEGLKVIILSPFNDKERSLKNFWVDGWGTPFKYEYEPDYSRCMLTSAGRDATFNTKDDLSIYIEESSETYSAPF